MMLKKCVKKSRCLLILLLLISLAVFVMYAPSFALGKYFVGGGDVKTQWYPFYVLGRRETLSSLKSRTLPFYSFVLFLGNNIWASKTSYGLFDVYNVLSYAIKTNYFAIYDTLTAIKLLTSSVSMFLLLRKITGSDRASLVGGLCYGLSSFAIYYTSQPGFLSFYSLAPLYFLGIECYLVNNKKTLFVVMVFLLLLTNYYFFYAASVFSPIYFLYRYYNLKESLSGWFPSALSLIGYYLIGVLCSGIVIIPAFLYVIQNDRIGGIYNVLTYSDLSIYYHLLVSIISPSQSYIYGNNVFDNSAHTLKEICLYAGSVTALLTGQFLFDKDNKYRISTMIVYLLMIGISVMPLTGSLMNGFGEPCFRWFYLFIIMNIITVSRYTSGVGIINKKGIWATATIITMCSLWSFVKCVDYKGLSVNDFYIQISLVTVSLICMCLCSLFIEDTSKLCVVTFAELTFFAGVFGNNVKVNALNNKELKQVTNVIADDSYYEYLKEYLDSLSDNNANEYYRIYVPYDSLYWYFSHDMAVIYNINGLMTYDSTYAQSFNKMRKIDHDGIVENIEWEFNIKNLDIINFLSTKYSITSTVDEIPFNNYHLVDEFYRGGLIVAENEDYQPILRTYESYMSYKDLLEIHSADTAKLINTVISDVDVSSQIGSSHAIASWVAYGTNTFDAKIECESDSFAVAGIPYDAGWNIYINEKKTEYIECNGGFIGFALNQGSNNIHMEFVPEGFKTGAIVSVIGFLLLSGIIMVEIRKRSRI